MANFSDYMVQHILYINGIQKSINHQTVFTHKQATECAFGRMFYTDIKPKLDSFSGEKQGIIEELEKMHTAFHEIAVHIAENNPNIEKAKQDAWLYSSKLVNLLNYLEKMSN